MFNPRFPMNLIENKHPVKEPSDPSEDLFSLLGLGCEQSSSSAHSALSKMNPKHVITGFDRRQAFCDQGKQREGALGSHL